MSFYTLPTSAIPMNLITKPAPQLKQVNTYFPQELVGCRAVRIAPLIYTKTILSTQQMEQKVLQYTFQHSYGDFNFMDSPVDLYLDRHQQIIYQKGSLTYVLPPEFCDRNWIIYEPSLALSPQCKSWVDRIAKSNSIACKLLTPVPLLSLPFSPPTPYLNYSNPGFYSQNGVQPAPSLITAGAQQASHEQQNQKEAFAATFVPPATFPTAAAAPIPKKPAPVIIEADDKMNSENVEPSTLKFGGFLTTTKSQKMASSTAAAPASDDADFSNLENLSKSVVNALITPTTDNVNSDFENLSFFSN